MDGRIKSGHDGVAVEEEQGEPGAARLIAMPPPHVMPGLDPGIHGRCMQNGVRPVPIAMPPDGSPRVRSRMDGRIESGHDVVGDAVMGAVAARGNF